MRKFFLIILFLWLVFKGAVSAFCENWYIVNIYNVKFDQGYEFQMRTVARMYDEETCYEVAKLEAVNPQDAACISTYCANGKDYDKALTPLFNNCPVKEVYVSFIDKYGYETRVDFLKAPSQALVPFAESIAKRFKEGGASEVRVVYPESETSIQEVMEEISEDSIEEIPDMAENREKQEEQKKIETPMLTNFDIGSTKDHVKKVQGEPTSIINNVWFYETDMVVFDKMNRVSDYSNFSRKLKIGTNVNLK